MRIALFGASGGTGRQIAGQALERGHAVTAMVRDESSFDAAFIRTNDKLGLEVLDVMDPAAVAKSIAGHDAVASALGPREKGPTTVQSDATRAILEAMTATSVRRLVVVSAAGFHTEGDDPFTKSIAKPIIGRILRHQFADMRAMEALVTASPTDWTIMLPPKLNDGRLMAQYRSARDKTVPRGFNISRADLAHAVLDVLEDPTAIRTTVAVAR
ncbi:NAD(P)H-binding protein [Georgenia halophila]|uniref:NAD(P)H-binding protein n=1 Tax=Georgenia halophila TaxID=620889 RepID=A0ABP8KX42_9MICO